MIHFEVVKKNFIKCIVSMAVESGLLHLELWSQASG